jgi:glyoxylate reductase
VARCFVTHQLPGPALARLEAAHDVEVWPGRLPPEPAQLAEHVREAEGLLCLLTDRIDAGLLDHAPRLRVIANYAVGYDNVDLRAAAARGIAVGNTPGVLTDATADLAFALLLAAARKLPEGIADVRNGEWLPWEPDHLLGAELRGATLGLIGFGRIGQAVAKRAGGFGMHVIHTDSRSDQAAVEELLGSSDFVSVHAPLTPATRHLINGAALARMKPSAILINTSRGGLVDQRALAQALREGAIAGAALDVTDPEPLPPDDPLLTAPNLIVVPHIGSATTATRERMADLAVENLLAGLDGRPLPHPVPAPG